jgi:ubiquinone biosynthesis protein
MIFDHGFFHGDPHPGNLLVQKDGTVVVLDFGLAKELPPGFADGAATMIARGMAGDSAGALAAARSIGFEVGGAQPERFVDLVRMLMGERGGPKRLVEVLDASPVEKVPSHFTLIGRVFILLNGLSHRLVPGERIIAGAVLRQLGPRVMAAAAARGTAAS